MASTPSDVATTNKEEDVWSGEEDDDADLDGDGDANGTRKRKRTSRPVSVSCERCKERKVGDLLHSNRIRHAFTYRPCGYR